MKRIGISLTVLLVSGIQASHCTSVSNEINNFINSLSKEDFFVSYAGTHIPQAYSSQKPIIHYKAMGAGAGKKVYVKKEALLGAAYGHEEQALRDFDNLINKLKEEGLVTAGTEQMPRLNALVVYKNPYHKPGTLGGDMKYVYEVLYKK